MAKQRAARVAMADSPWEESLVLVCGPPCTGKTAVARQHADYRRLSFDSCCDNQSGTHRSKSRLVKKKLANGRVCLDDQHLESSLRKNLVNWTVKDLAPPQQALCVWCEPEGGRTQCIWANEWNMVAALEAGAARSEYMPLALSVQRSDEAYGGKHKRSLEPWFPSGSAVVPKPPAEADLLAEGFRRVLAMPRLPLCPELHGTFHRAGLVIDAHAVLEDRAPSGGRAPPLVGCLHPSYTLPTPYLHPPRRRRADPGRGGVDRAVHPRPALRARRAPPPAHPALPG